MYTSDGRDVEMSVASTKAFYAQVAAGVLLACAIAEAAGRGTAHRRHELLTSLRTLPGRDGGGASPIGPPSPTPLDASPRQALLGHRRQRAEHGGRRGSADQAQRALLQEHRLRRHRGQEAHRPVQRAADPRVRRRSGRWHRRRRGQGSGHLQGAQGHADRHRHRRRRALRRCRRGAHRAVRGLLARVRAVGDDRSPVRLRGGAGHRRVGPAAARGPRGHRARARRGRSTATPCCSEVQAGIVAHTEKFLDGLRAGSTTVTSRPVHRGAPRRPAPRPRHASRRSRPTSAPPARSPRRACVVDDLTAALTRAIEELTRPVDAIKHQAKTVTVGISRNDEGVLDRPLVQELLACRRRARPPELPHAEGARRSRSRRGGRGRASPATPSTAIPRVGATIAIVDRGGLSRDVPSRVETQLAAARHQAPRRQREGGARRPRSQRRPHGDLRAGGEGWHVHRHHAAARALPRSSARGGDARRAAGLRPPLRPPRRLGDGDRGRLPRRPARRPAGGRPADPADLRAADHWRPA